MKSLESSLKGPGDVVRVAPHDNVRTLTVAWKAGGRETLNPFQARDPITGLPDRNSFLSRLQRELGRTRGSAPFAVALVDLDDFKALNHTLGYAAGDALLAQVARRLETCLRRGDVLARFDADEFAIIMDEVDASTASSVCERILEALAVPFIVTGQEACPLASVGMAVRHAGHTRPEDIFRDADRALSRAKALGGGRCEVFEADMDARALALSQLEVALRRALESPEFQNHYQPIISVKGGQVAGFEVLLWRKSARSIR
jgi:diguanylate cyclase (GGDEF)-like protein